MLTMLTFLSENITPVLVFVASLLAIWITMRRPSGIPPGPGFPLPIFGHIFSVGKDPRKIFREWRRKYGDIFSLYLGNRLVIVMNGYDVMVDAFVKHGDVFSDRPHMFIFDKIFKGMSITGHSGPVWKEQRRFALSTLRDFGMGKRVLEDAINEECALFLKDINDINGEKFNIRHTVNTAVANIIFNILAGKRYSYDDAFFKKLTAKSDENFQSAGITAALNFIPLANYIPGDPFKVERTVKNFEFFDNEFFKPAIEEHLKNFDEDNIKDFVAAYIKEIKLKEKQGEETSIGLEKLLKVLRELVGAGSETTTTTIQWVILLFIKYPEVQEKCFRETEEIVGLERLPQVSDKLKLPFTEATITEVQRFADIVPLSLWHSVPHDIIFRGFSFPKGVIVVPNLNSVLHDPTIFEDPEEFRPVRFLDENGKFIKPAEMIPFSLGKRACLGESLAKMELFLFVTGLIQRFQFQEPEDEPPPTVEAVPGVTFAPKPFKVKAIPRSHRRNYLTPIYKLYKEYNSFIPYMFTCTLSFCCKHIFLKQ